MAKRAGTAGGGGGRTGDVRAGRVKRVRAAMREIGVDTMVVSRDVDILWLTGFHGEASVAVVGPRSVSIVSDRRFEEELGRVSGVRACVRGAGVTMGEGIATVVGSKGVVGVQGEAMSAGMCERLAKLLGAKRMRLVGDVLGGLRAVKDAGEVRAIAKAVRLQEAALEEVLEQIEAGMTEREVAARLEYAMKARGAEGVSFATIAAAGANSSLPHARPGGAKVRRNGVLLIDWGAKVGGYVGDLTRTFAFGRWPREMAAVYDIVREALHAGVEAVRPGVTGREVDSVARGVIEGAGHGERFAHSLGHGIGLEVHEMPRLGQASEDVLEAGMVVTVEPGIYLPGVGGVRLEQDVVVTERGRRVLSSLPTDRRWATRG